MMYNIRLNHDIIVTEFQFKGVCPVILLTLNMVVCDSKKSTLKSYIYP